MIPSAGFNPGAAYFGGKPPQPATHSLSQPVRFSGGEPDPFRNKTTTAISVGVLLAAASVFKLGGLGTKSALSLAYARQKTDADKVRFLKEALEASKRKESAFSPTENWAAGQVAGLENDADKLHFITQLSRKVNDHAFEKLVKAMRTIKDDEIRREAQNTLSPDTDWD